MHSLRIRLVLISTLISGVAIVGMAVLSWFVMRRTVLESIDIRLAGIAGRTIRDMHPRVDWNSITRTIDITHGDDMEEGVLILYARDDVNDEVVYSSVDKFDELRSNFPEGFPSAVPEPRRRPEWHDPLERLERINSDSEQGPPARPRPAGAGGSGGFPKGKGEKGKWKDGDRPPPLSGKKGPGRAREGQEEYATASYDGKRWRFVVVRERGYFILAGLDLSRSREELKQLERGLLIAVPIALAMIAFGGWLVAERALRPLRTISETASQVTARELSARMPENKDTDPEISRLVAVLNRMMDRLEMSFSHANRFSADVSHELKTPLAIIQGEIESALRECRPGTSEEKRLLVLREETNRLKSIIRSLMLLSQADVGELIRKTDRVQVTEELISIVEDAEIMAESANVFIDAVIEEGAEIIGDAVLLRQALLNLVNNAIKYNKEDGFVRLELSKVDGKLKLVVANSGPGIAEEEREKVFDRFFRADAARSRGVHGFGLGLSLAKAVFEGHGGKLVLEHADEEETRFVVTLPPAPRLS
ncbi:MAG: hypothetical protein CMO55_18865 [Verrucomicrobiales bacterium]|nr:hypothetical protein [Verrucomicrobiales bacterium]